MFAQSSQRLLICHFVRLSDLIHSSPAPHFQHSPDSPCLPFVAFTSPISHSISAIIFNLLIRNAVPDNNAGQVLKALYLLQTITSCHPYLQRLILFRFLIYNMFMPTFIKIYFRRFFLALGFFIFGGAKSLFIIIMMFLVKYLCTDNKHCSILDKIHSFSPISFSMW